MTKKNTPKVDGPIDWTIDFDGQEYILSAHWGATKYESKATIRRHPSEPEGCIERCRTNTVAAPVFITPEAQARMELGPLEPEEA